MTKFYFSTCLHFQKPSIIFANVNQNNAHIKRIKIAAAVICTAILVGCSQKTDINNEQQNNSSVNNVAAHSDGSVYIGDEKIYDLKCSFYTAVIGTPGYTTTRNWDFMTVQKESYEDYFVGDNYEYETACVLSIDQISYKDGNISQTIYLRLSDRNYVCKIENGAIVKEDSIIDGKFSLTETGAGADDMSLLLDVDIRLKTADGLDIVIRYNGICRHSGRV